MSRIIPALVMTILWSTLAFSAHGQVIPASEKTMSTVIEVKGIDKKELFARANSWTVSNFTDPQSSIQVIDKELGKIAGKYYAELMVGPSYFGTLQVIEVDVKDAKARIVFQNPKTIFLGSVFGRKGKQAGFDWADVYDKKVMAAMNAHWKKLVSSLEAKLQKSDDF